VSCLILAGQLLSSLFALLSPNLLSSYLYYLGNNGGAVLITQSEYQHLRSPAYLSRQGNYLTPIDYTDNKELEIIDNISPYPLPCLSLFLVFNFIFGRYTSVENGPLRCVWCVGGILPLSCCLGYA